MTLLNSNLANRNKYEIPIHCQLRLYEGLPGTKFAHTGLSEGAFWNADNAHVGRQYGLVAEEDSRQW